MSTPTGTDVSCTFLMFDSQVDPRTSYLNHLFSVCDDVSQVLVHGGHKELPPRGEKDDRSGVSPVLSPKLAWRGFHTPISKTNASGLDQNHLWIFRIFFPCMEAAGPCWTLFFRISDGTNHNTLEHRLIGMAPN